jgi:hypothetical protein
MLSSLDVMIPARIRLYLMNADLRVIVSSLAFLVFKHPSVMVRLKESFNPP